MSSKKFHPFKDFQFVQVQRSSRNIFTVHYACRMPSWIWHYVTGITNGFIFFQIFNSLTESWGVHLTCLDCKYKISLDHLRLRFLTIHKKIPEILVENFRSVRTVRVVNHLPKISGLSRRPSFNMKLVRNSRNFWMVNEFPFGTSQPGLPFQSFRLSGEFSNETNQKHIYHLHPNGNFREFVVNGKQHSDTERGVIHMILQ